MYMEDNELEKIMQRKNMPQGQMLYEKEKDALEWEAKHGKVCYDFKDKESEPTIPNWLKSRK